MRLDCDGPVQATADPGYVRTILENLVDNSMHALRDAGRADAGGAGKTGRITIRVASEDGRAVVAMFTAIYRSARERRPVSP